MINGVILLTGFVFFLIALILAPKLRRKTEERERAVATSNKKEASKPAEEAKASKEKEEVPKTSKRGKLGRFIWTILVIFAVVGLVIFVIWLWQNNRGPKELSTPDCSTYYDLTSAQLAGNEEAVRKVTVCDDWLPLATVMPTWYSKEGDWERKFFDTDQYVVLMRINKGEPFKFSTGSGMEQGKRSYSIDEYLAAEVMMDPNGLHPVGFVTFRLKR